MNAVARIKAYFHELKASYGGLRREDICFLMVQARHLIELSPTPERYPVTAFYTNWVVHTSLDRSRICLSILRDVTGTLAVNFNRTRVDISRLISEIIGFPLLRAELIEIFQASSLSTVLFDTRGNWQIFVRSLLWLIADQPISWPTPLTAPARALRSEMDATERPYNITVEKLMIENREDVFHWVVNVASEKGDVKLVGQVEIAESPDPFCATE